MQSVVLLVLCAATPAADPKKSPVPGLKPAQDEYRAAVAKAQAAYDAEVKKAAADYRGKLKAVQDARTKAGDLDGAIAARQLLAELDAAAPPPPMKPKEPNARDRFDAAVSRVVWTPGPGGWRQPFALAPDGYVYSPPGNRWNNVTWAAIAPGTVVVMSAEGVVDVFSIDLNRGTAAVSSLGLVRKSKVRWEASVRPK